MGTFFRIAALLGVLTISSEEGRAWIKKALKSGVRAGLMARERASEIAVKALEFKEELMVEIADEHKDESSSKNHKSKKHNEHASSND